MKGISVIIPAYNEEENIETVIKRSLAALEKTSLPYEVIVVNDGSSDRTGKIIDFMAKENKKIRALHHKKNKGVGQGLKLLWKSAKYDYIIDLPGDNQQNPAEIELFLPLIKDFDVVCGYRKKRVDPAHRTWFKNLYHFILRILFGIKVRDVDWIKMYKKEVMDNIKITSKSAFVIAEAVIRAQRAGYKITEVGVTHLPRLAGQQTGAKPKVMLKQLFDVFTFWFNLNFRGK